MALAEVQSAMTFGEHKTLHPFFSKTKRVPSPERNESPQPVTDPETVQIHDQGPTIIDPSSTNTKKRVRKNSKPKESGRNGLSMSNQASLDKFARRPKDLGGEKEPEPGVSGASKATGFKTTLEVEPSLVEDPNADRRKRRKTASPPPSAIYSIGLNNAQKGTESSLPSWHEQLFTEATKLDEVLVMASSPHDVTQSLALQDDAIPITPTKAVTERDISSIPSTSPLLSAQSLKTNALPDFAEDLGGQNAGIKAISPTKKKKQLKINSRGKISSPVSKNKSSPKKTRGKRASRKSQLTTVTIIKYGSNAKSRVELGNRITQIMEGKKEQRRQPPKVMTKPLGPPKPTHPFFMGKPLEKSEAVPTKGNEQNARLQPPRTPKRTAATPGKLRAQAQSSRSPTKSMAFRPILGDPKALRHPGLSEASWPSRDNLHVRGQENCDEQSLFLSRPLNADAKGLQSSRKLKRNVIKTSDEDDIILKASRYLGRLDLSVERERADAFRVPERLLTTGVAVTNAVCRELHSQMLKAEEHHSAGQSVHPAISRIFSSIKDTLTPFDKGECESQAWTQKYAPKTAIEVLLSGKEALVLRDWLKSLTVMSVEVSNKPKDRLDLKPKPAKKKRKKELDDFIVSEGDDNDIDEMDELTDPEDMAAPDSRLGWKKSLIRVSRQDHTGLPKSTRPRNVVLLSGPHGSGKTATVYAVAKELGFEVFEINPGSRRSGKDILDKVGDMSENHLVNHKSSEPKAMPIITEFKDADQNRMAEALQEDLDSGRQGTMTSFFKPAAQPQAKSKPDSTVKRSPKVLADVQPKIQRPQNEKQNQKQSLILLEEVDVLFKEDESFWATVIKLATQSKRPIVMTCNDERFVAINALPLHAILRLCPTSVDLAADYLLLLAAKEGHLLERKAIRDLYQSKDYDLRASITEVDFWCQMSVGDKKGGLEWIYQRWPPGKDVDESGRILRVASKGTYRSGMGWFSNDALKCEDWLAFDREEELLSEAWSMWGIKPECWARPPSDHQNISDTSAIRRNIQTLKQLEGLLDCVSAADNYCGVGLASNNTIPMDPSQPPMPRNTHLNFTEDCPLLQAYPLVDPTHFGESLYVRTHLAAQRAASSYSISYFEDLATTYYSNPSLPDNYTDAVISHKTSSRAPGDLTRWDFSDALDPLTVPPSNVLTYSAPSFLVASSFDRELRVIVEDLAPYARSIVKHEQKLEAERLRMSTLLSHGGRAKRLRTSRASRSALEGGKRQEKRRERWFTRELNMELVMATGGKSWTGMGTDVDSLASESRNSGSVRTTISEDEDEE